MDHLLPTLFHDFETFTFLQVSGLQSDALVSQPPCFQSDSFLLRILLILCKFFLNLEWPEQTKISVIIFRPREVTQLLELF